MAEVISDEHPSTPEETYALKFMEDHQQHIVRAFVEHAKDETKDKNTVLRAAVATLRELIGPVKAEATDVMFGASDAAWLPHITKMIKILIERVPDEDHTHEAKKRRRAPSKPKTQKQTVLALV